LAIVRTGEGGGLIDVSVVERVPVPTEQLLKLVRTPESWPTLLKPVSRVRVTGRDAAGVNFQMTVAGMFFDVVTDFRMNWTARGAAGREIPAVNEGSAA